MLAIHDVHGGLNLNSDLDVAWIRFHFLIERNMVHRSEEKGFIISKRILDSLQSSLFG